MNTVWVMLTERKSWGKSHDFFEAAYRAIKHAAQSCETLYVIKVTSEEDELQHLEKTTRVDELGGLVTTKNATVEEKGALTAGYFSKVIMQAIAQANRMEEKIDGD